MIAASTERERQRPRYDRAALTQVANGQATKIFLPAELSGILGSVGAIGELFKDVPPSPTPPGGSAAAGTPIAGSSSSGAVEPIGP